MPSRPFTPDKKIIYMVTTPLAPGWQRIPGAARRYINTRTGETLSRRKYDERFGRLAGTGLTNESLAKKNKEENPLASAMRPRRGRKKLDELKEYENQIKRNKKPLQDPNYFITEFLVQPVTEYTIATAISALSGIKNAVGYRRVITIETGEGSEIVTSTPYRKMPKSVDAVIKELEELMEYLNLYKFGEGTKLKSVRYIIRLRK